MLMLRNGRGIWNDRAMREIDAFHERRKQSAKGGRTTSTKSYMGARAQTGRLREKDVPHSAELLPNLTQTSAKPSGHLLKNQTDGLHPPPSPSPTVKETPSDEGAKKGTEDHDHPSRRGTRLDTDWTPSAEDRAHAESLGYDAQIIDELAENFRFYWTQGTGRNRTTASWSQCWQVWCRNDRRRPGSPRGAGNGQQAPSPHEKLLAGFARAAAREQ